MEVQSPTLSATTDQPQPTSRICWKGRHVQLQPSWYQKSKIVKPIGWLLAGLGMGIWCQPPTGSRWSLVGAAATLVAGARLVTQDYWEDPVYRLRQGQRAWADIRCNTLPFPQLWERYGEKIENYSILQKADLRLYLLDELCAQTWGAFKEKHTFDAFDRDILDRHDPLVKQRLLEAMAPHNYAAIKDTFRDELEKYQIVSEEEVGAVIQKQCEGKTLQRIMHEQGPAFWEIISQDLVFPDREQLRQSLLEEIIDLSFSTIRHVYCAPQSMWGFFREGLLAPQDLRGSVVDELDRTHSFSELIHRFGWKAFDYGLLRFDDQQVAAIMQAFLEEEDLAALSSSGVGLKLIKHGVLPPDVSGYLEDLLAQLEFAEQQLEEAHASAVAKFERKRAKSEGTRSTAINNAQSAVSKAGRRLAEIQAAHREDLRAHESGYQRANLLNDRGYARGRLNLWTHLRADRSNERSYLEGKGEIEKQYQQQLKDLESEMIRCEQHLTFVRDSQDQRHRAEILQLTVSRDHQIEAAASAFKHAEASLEKEYRQLFKCDGNASSEELPDLSA